MTTTSPIAGLPAPDDSSPNDPPIHFDALNDVLDPIVVPRFTSTGARNTAYANYVTAGGVMKDGMPCRVDGVGFMFYDLSTATWRTAASTNYVDAAAATNAAAISALKFPQPVAITVGTGQYDHTGTTEVKVGGGTNEIGTITGMTLSTGRCYKAVFRGRAWAGSASVQITLRIRVGLTLNVSSNAVASQAIRQPDVGPTNINDTKFEGEFTVQSNGSYSAAVYGVTALGSFAVGPDARGRYELIIFDVGPAISGLAQVTG